jgi:hypothetical protein
MNKNDHKNDLKKSHYKSEFLLSRLKFCEIVGLKENINFKLTVFLEFNCIDKNMTKAL